MSCIKPMAPLRETARGLKFDSTLTTARTRFGSTPCRCAAASMALSTVSEVGWTLVRSSVFGETGCEDIKALLAFLLTGAPDTISFTSWAARRAAFMVGEETSGTGIQRCSLLLQ